jgi:(p)ppGpp synthase/HD superfamily hydrolase
MPDTQRLLELALKGLEAERAKIDGEIVQVRSQLNPRSTVARVNGAGNTTPQPAKRTMSAAARRKISQAMKRKHAERNRTVSVGAVTRVRKSAGPKQNAGSGLTPAGRKRLSDLMKKRWAERRKAKAK